MENNQTGGPNVPSQNCLFCFLATVRGNVVCRFGNRQAVHVYHADNGIMFTVEEFLLLEASLVYKGIRLLQERLALRQ